MRDSYMKVNAKSFEELIEKYNPFALKDAKGEVMLFSDYGKCYEYIFNCVRAECPRGYLDVPLFMQKRTGMPFADCKRFVHSWWRHDEVIRIDWTFLPEARKYLIDLVDMFHKISETTTDHEKLQVRLAVFLSEVKVKMEELGATVVM